MQSDLIAWVQSGERLRYSPGERLTRPDEINSSVFLVLKGSVRLIAVGDEREGQFTLDKRGAGQLIGWTSLLRGGPTEHVQASTDVVALSLPAGKFVTFIQDVPDFANYFYSLSNQQEAYIVATAIADLSPKRNSDWRDGFLSVFNKHAQ